MTTAVAKRKTSTRAVARGMKPVSEYTLEDLDILEAIAIHEARESFWAFRQYMRPKMIKGWWPREVAHELQRFYEELCAGLAPMLVLQAPPQHGKSWAVNDFLAWVAGKNPELKQIFASFSERLGVRANLYLQRVMDSEKYNKVFPDTYLNTSNVVTISGQYLRNREMLEFVNHEGSFRNTTVQGPVTGESLDLGVIDDPIKGRAEASSKATRDKTWAWLTDDFMTRFSEHGALLITLTRWHLDDPVGRLIAEFPGLRVLRYAALAEKNELNPDGTLRRRKGEALFPELKSREFILRRKKVMTVAGFQSVYQQNPIIIGGSLFPVENLTIVPTFPSGVKVIKRIRYWDKAGTKDGGAWTAGVRMAALSDGRYLIEDVKRKQLSAFDREALIKQTATDDGRDVIIGTEQEPGSGGKESAERTIAMLAGYQVFKDRVTGDKETRAEPYAAQVQGGTVLMLAGAWNKQFLDEHEFFPNGPYKDQVDAAGGAFAKLTNINGKKAGVLF